MLTSKVTTQLTHPSEAGVTFTIRKLSFAAAQEAEDAKRDAAIRMFTAISDIADKLPSSDEAAAAANQPENKYDRMVVLRCGLTAWSYQEELTPDNIADLDEETALWLFGEIIRHSFRSADEGEA